MTKYENGLNVDLNIWNVAMLTAIANELAEANRLKRLELGKTHDLVRSILEDEAK